MLAIRRWPQTRGLRFAVPVGFIVLSVGCGLAGPYSGAGKRPNVVSLDPADWRILYSADMPPHPSPDPAGAWSFKFPTSPPEGAGGPQGHVNYVEVPFVATVPLRSITVSFSVVSDNAQWVTFGDSLPATCRIMIEMQYDDLTYPDGRFWADGNPPDQGVSPFVLGAAQMQQASFVIPLTPDHWTNVYGQQDAQGFTYLLAHIGWVGITFGGLDFAGHGSAVSGGSAKFILLNFQVNQ